MVKNSLNEKKKSKVADMVLEKKQWRGSVPNSKAKPFVKRKRKLKLRIDYHDLNAGVDGTLNTVFLKKKYNFRQ